MSGTLWYISLSCYSLLYSLANDFDKGTPERLLTGTNSDLWYRTSLQLNFSGDLLNVAWMSCEGHDLSCWSTDDAPANAPAATGGNAAAVPAPDAAAALRVPSPACCAAPWRLRGPSAPAAHHPGARSTHATPASGMPQSLMTRAEQGMPIPIPLSYLSALLTSHQCLHCALFLVLTEVVFTSLLCWCFCLCKVNWKPGLGNSL